MNNEINKLELEIKILKERVASLERKEKSRKIKSIIKFIITLIIIFIIIIFSYNFYQKIVNMYDSFLLNF